AFATEEGRVRVNERPARIAVCPDRFDEAAAGKAHVATSADYARTLIGERTRGVEDQQTIVNNRAVDKQGATAAAVADSQCAGVDGRATGIAVVIGEDHRAAAIQGYRGRAVDRARDEESAGPVEINTRAGCG